MRLTVLLLVLVAVPVQAKTLYVNPGHASDSDSTTYAANDANNPWTTIGRCVWGNATRASANSSEAAAAGDTCLVSAGTYSMAGNNNKYDATLTPMNSGSSGSPIIIQCVTAGACDLRHSSGTGAIAGAYGTGPFGATDYITWDGFLIDDNNVTSEPDTGPFVFVNCTGCVLKNSTIKGEIGLPLSDNYDCVRIDSSFDIFIQNNTIQDCSGIPSQHGRNHAGIQTYYSSRLTIEHNTITNCGSGIFIKGMSDGALPGYQWQIIRLNLVYANETAGILIHLSPGSSTYPAKIYQNIVRDNGQAGIRFQAFNQGTFDARSVQVVNNTIVDNFIGFHILNAMVTNAGHAFWNNIVKGGSYCINVEGTSDLATSKITSEHNIGHGCSDWAEVFGTSRTLAAWQSTYTQDDAIPDSQFTDPLFTNYATNVFTLQVGSPALSGCGVDMLDLDGDLSTVDAVTCGAYITGSEEIGLQSGGADTTDPVVTITTPTSSATYSTSATPLTVAGTCTDNVLPTAVTWVNAAGGSGTASGTGSWSANVALTSGSNAITVTCVDAAANDHTDVITVTYTPPVGTGTGLPRMPRRLYPGGQE